MSTAAAPALEELRQRIAAAVASRTPLRIRGGGSKDFHAETLRGEILDTRAHTGIVSYDPSELVITARAGTPLSEIEQALAQHAQYLAFEPPSFGGEATFGGMIAAGLSGPRRASVGAIRDFVLGAHLLGASGEVLRFGGQVMKNVAGFDVSRLLCGSFGVLGLITEVSVKVLPRPRAELTLCFEMNEAEALVRFNTWGGQPLPISATSWHGGRACLRLSGARSALQAACASLGGERLAEDAAQTWWEGLRQQTLDVFTDPAPNLWRCSVPSTAPRATVPSCLVEWGGALRWVRSSSDPATLRAMVGALGGTASLWRGSVAGSRIHPLAPAVLALQQRLKAQFDPHGIFNPQRMVLEF